MLNRTNIAIVDDEKDIRDMLSYNLKSQGYSVIPYSNGEELILDIKNNKFDLIILDVMMPKLDGFETCKKIKSDFKNKDIPIIFLTAKDDEFDEVIGLEIGAADYIIKPIKIKIIIARIRSALRDSKRKNISDNEASIMISQKSRQLLVQGKKVSLTRIEFDILYRLMNDKNRVFSRNEIIDFFHADNIVISDRAVDVHIRNIRKKIKEYSHYIITHRGVGYSYSDDV